MPRLSLARRLGNVAGLGRGVAADPLAGISYSLLARFSKAILYQDTAATVPAAAEGDVVKAIRSERGNLTFTQSDAAKCATVAYLAGCRMLNCTSGNVSYTLTTGTLPMASGVLISQFKITATGTFNTLLNKTTSGSPRPFDLFTYPDDDTLFAHTGGTAQNTPCGTDNFRTLSVRYDTAVPTLTYYLDGAPDGTTSYNTGTDTGAVMLFSRDDEGTHLKGYCAAIALAPASMSLEEQATTEAHFATLSRNVTYTDIAANDSTFLAGLSPLAWSKQSGYVAAGCAGSWIKMEFDGATDVVLTVNVEDSGAGPLLAWRVNGGSYRTHHLIPGETQVILEEGKSISSIELYARAVNPYEDRWIGSPPPNVVNITGLRVNSEASLTTTPDPRPVLLSIGDSITSGDGTLGNGGVLGYTFATDSWKSYAHLLADHFGYQDARLAWGGWRFSGTLELGGVPEFPEAIDNVFDGVTRLSVGKLADPVDFALICLGENGPTTAAEVSDSITHLRSRLEAGVKIAVIVPFSGTGRSPVTTGFNDYQTATPDALAYLIDIGWNGPTGNYDTSDGQHPSSAGHVTIYNALLPLLEPLFP